MHRPLVLAVILAGALLAPTLPAAAEPAFARLVLLRMNRQHHENAVWMTERATMAGGESVPDYVQGLGGAQDSVAIYSLEGKFDLFEAVIGYLDSAPDGQVASFEVMADAVSLYRSEPISSADKPQRIRIPVKERQVLLLRILPTRYNDTQGAVWGDPVLWTGIPQDQMIPTVLDMKVGGRETRVRPDFQPSGTQLPVPVPLQPGTHEYRVKVHFDQEKATVEVDVTGEAAPAPAQP